ncbi:hypothetical protein VTK26DRAFT_4387 [Humicola hyalothermophila]
MEAVSTYCVSSLAWLSAQALPLITWPSFISTLLRVDDPTSVPGYRASHAALEYYFARSLGLAQLALGLVLLVLSGALPLDSMVESPTTTEGKAVPPTPYANAAVLLSALYHAATASYAYTRYHATGQLGFLLACLAGSALAVAGLWVLMFAGEANRRVSRRTGADKSTSGWPFRNVEADRKRR